MKGSLMRSVAGCRECHCFEEMLSFRKAKHRVVLFQWQIPHKITVPIRKL